MNSTTKEALKGKKDLQSRFLCTFLCKELADFSSSARYVLLSHALVNKNSSLAQKLLHQREAVHADCGQILIDPVLPFMAHFCILQRLDIEPFYTFLDQILLRGSPFKIGFVKDDHNPLKIIKSSDAREWYEPTYYEDDPRNADLCRTKAALRQSKKTDTSDCGNNVLSRREEWLQSLIQWPRLMTRPVRMIDEECSRSETECNSEIEYDHSDEEQKKEEEKEAECESEEGGSNADTFEDEDESDLVDASSDCASAEGSVHESRGVEEEEMSDMSNESYKESDDEEEEASEKKKRKGGCEVTITSEEITLQIPGRELLHRRQSLTLWIDHLNLLLWSGEDEAAEKEANNQGPFYESMVKFMTRAEGLLKAFDAAVADITGMY